METKDGLVIDKEFFNAKKALDFARRKSKLLPPDKSEVVGQ